MGLRTRIIMLTGLMLVIATLLFGIATYRTQEKALLSGIDGRLEATARLAREILPADYHDNIGGADAVSAAEYLRIVDRWNRLCKELELEYIWSLMLIDGKTVFTSASSTSKDVTKGDHAKFFETHSNPELYTAAFTTLKPQYQINDDKWGRIKVVLLPFKDAKGRPCLFGASMKTTAVDALLRKTVWQSLEISAGILFLGLFLSVVLSASLVRPLEKLTALARSITQGNWGQVVEPSGAKEIRSLARSVNEMSRSIEDKITARKLAEDELSKSDDRYKTLFSRANDGIFILTAEGKLVEVNESFARMHGYSTQEMRTMSLKDFDTPETSQLVGERMQRLFAEGALTFEVEHYHRDGHVFPLEVSANLITYDGESYIQCFHRDITERRLAEEETANLQARLQQAQKMEAIGTMAGGIAHDFNNILAAIIGYTEMAMAEDKPEVQRQYLQQTLKGTERATDMVRQILTFSRQDSHEKKPLDVKILLKESVKFLRASIPSTIEIRQLVTDESCNIMADPTQMHQVIMNLCINAAHAMKQTGGILKVELSTIALAAGELPQHPDLMPGHYVKLAVSDTGHGIDPALQHRIFDPFFTTKTKDEGTGLGLSVVYGIVNSHDGVIHVYSEPGKGASFNVYLPRIIPEAMVSRSVSGTVSGGTERILFVDDEPDLVDIGRLLLSSLGYEVTGVTDSMDALDMFRAAPGRFDLVITDMTLPKMTGIDLSREIMQIRPDIPIILCSGIREAATEEQVKAMGIRAYCIKPLTRKDLSRVIRDALDRRGNTLS